MSDYGFLAISSWAASEIIPAMFFEIWLVRRYEEMPSAVRLLLAFTGPLAFAAIVFLMNEIEEDDDE